MFCRRPDQCPLRADTKPSRAALDARYPPRSRRSANGRSPPFGDIRLGPGRRDAASVERLSASARRLCAALLDFGDDRQDVRGVTARIGFERGCGASRAAAMFGLPSFRPRVFAARSATFVRCEIRARSRRPNALVGDPAGPREATRLSEIKDKPPVSVIIRRVRVVCSPGPSGRGCDAVGSAPRCSTYGS